MSRGLARFAAISAVAFVLSRILGLVRDQVLAATFTLAQIDAYRIALVIPDMLFTLMSGGALASAFIPMFVRLREDGQRDAAWRMASGILLVLAGGVFFLSLLAWLGADQLVRFVLAPRAVPETQHLATQMFRIVLLQPLFLSLASLATSILQSYDRFALPAFSPVLYNVSIIASALLLRDRLGLYSVAVGVVVGGFLFLAIQVPGVLALGSPFRAAHPLADPNVRRIVLLLLPRIAGQAAVQLNTLVAVSLASGIGPDRVAALGFANTVFVLPIGLFGTSIATVAFPALSREAGEDDLRGFLYLLRRSMRGVLFFVVPASVGLIILREPIVSLLYQRGKFGPEDTVLTAEPLLYFSGAMWAFALVDMLPRAFFALGDTITPVKIAVGTVALDIALSFLLVRPLGLGGLALAFGIATVVQVGFLLLALTRRIGPVVDAATVGALGKSAAAAALMGVVLWALRPFWSDYQSMQLTEKLFFVLGTVSLGAAVYFASSLVLRQEELQTLRRIVRR